MQAIVKGTLKYSCEVRGFVFRSFDPMEIQANDRSVDKVVVECRNETPIEITVSFASASSADAAFITSKDICRKIVGRLALRYGLCIQEPLLVEKQLLEEKDGTKKNVVAGSIPMACSGKVSQKIEPQEVAKLKADLEDLRAEQAGLRRTLPRCHAGRGQCGSIYVTIPNSLASLPAPEG